MQVNHVTSRSLFVFLFLFVMSSSKKEAALLFDAILVNDTNFIYVHSVTKSSLWLTENSQHAALNTSVSTNNTNNAY